MNNKIKKSIKTGVFLGLNSMFIFGSGCTEQEVPVPPKQEKKVVEIKKTKRPDNQTHCLVVKKGYVGEDGEPTMANELYLRCSVQDYFIKFCESEVSSKEVVLYLNDGITVEMEVREGDWDACSDFPTQDRIGSYSVIKKIFK
jgi:hypothetical protein